MLVKHLSVFIDIVEFKRRFYEIRLIVSLDKIILNNIKIVIQSELILSFVSHGM